MVVVQPDGLLTLMLARVREVTSEGNSAVVLINLISVIFMKQLLSNEELIISKTD